MLKTTLTKMFFCILCVNQIHTCQSKIGDEET